jgi:predicted RNA binding protein YcfA (HicA-like mRNA interferase family)
MSNVRSAKEINSALRQKGFYAEKEGDHVRYYHLDSSGEETGIKTKISHGALGKTVSSKLISLMAKQLRLSKAQFLELIDCTLDEESYRVMLQSSTQ